MANVSVVDFLGSWVNKVNDVLDENLIEPSKPYPQLTFGNITKYYYRYFEPVTGERELFEEYVNESIPVDTIYIAYYDSTMFNAVTSYVYVPFTYVNSSLPKSVSAVAIERNSDNSIVVDNSPSVKIYTLLQNITANSGELYFSLTPSNTSIHERCRILATIHFAENEQYAEKDFYYPICFYNMYT